MWLYLWKPDLFTHEFWPIFKPGARQPNAWFLEIAFVRKVGMSVCMCVSAPEATNNIHVILNLYNQLNKFVALET